MLGYSTVLITAIISFALIRYIYKKAAREENGRHKNMTVEEIGQEFWDRQW